MAVNAHETGQVQTVYESHVFRPQAWAQKDEVKAKRESKMPQPINSQLETLTGWPGELMVVRLELARRLLRCVCDRREAATHW